MTKLTQKTGRELWQQWVGAECRALYTNQQLNPLRSKVLYTKQQLNPLRSKVPLRGETAAPSPQRSRLIGHQHPPMAGHPELPPGYP